ncbi:hypothetical protein [Streptomyces sporangiiformans]|uniref:hypothetical protein n=1 Tax=Streptomyces sporangiiformans TaxID=2315329 RepID=UPI001F09D51D|nr:hypothetical protein [Streptomyces sporangiiformans]
MLGGSEDPFFRRPLWLQARCAGQVLWACNEEHVDALSAYVGAQLRERGGMRPTRAMLARLPPWMKKSSHRGRRGAHDGTCPTGGRYSPTDRQPHLDVAYAGIPGYGHLDTFLGRGAALDVSGHILDFLGKRR